MLSWLTGLSLLSCTSQIIYLQVTVCFMKRHGLCYCADNACIKECAAFEAASQQAYLLIYEKANASDDPEMEVFFSISN